MERVNFAANFIINRDKEITGDNEVKDTYLKGASICLKRKKC